MHNVRPLVLIAPASSVLLLLLLSTTTTTSTKSSTSSSSEQLAVASWSREDVSRCWSIILYGTYKSLKTDTTFVYDMFLKTIQLAHVMCAAWGWRQRPPGGKAPGLLFVIRCLAQLFATGFQRFLARFSGRRRKHGSSNHKSPPWTILLALVVVTSLFSIVDACSSRTTPKPRPPTSRPNVTFHTYECPPDYAAWYCLNGARCFTVKIGPSLLYNCECSPGYMGVRCEYKDLDRSYLQSNRDYMLSQASIAGGATIAVFLVVIVCAMTYLHYKRRAKLSNMSKDCVDSSICPQVRPTFGVKWKTAAATTPNADLPLAAVLQHQHHQQQQGTTAMSPPPSSCLLPPTSMQQQHPVTRDHHALSMTPLTTAPSPTRHLHQQAARHHNP